MEYLLILAVVAYTVLTLYLIGSCDEGSLAARWLGLFTPATEWVSNYLPPILWPLTWPFFTIVGLLVPAVALFSSRLFVPRRFRRD